MSKTTEFEQFVGIPWRRESYPAIQAIASENKSANCIRLVHDVYREKFGVLLPVGLWPKEILEDERLFFTTVPQNERLIMGDIFIFGKKDEDLYKLHLGMYIGEKDDRGDSLIIHATNSFVSQSAIWPLRRFSEYPAYQRIYGIKRLQLELFDVFIKPFLYGNLDSNW